MRMVLVAAVRGHSGGGDSLVLAGHDTVWLGAPGWVVVAVLSSVAASVLTAWRLRRPWAGEEDPLGATDEREAES
jgi:hypothetical protein